MYFLFCFVLSCVCFGTMQEGQQTSMLNWKAFFFFFFFFFYSILLGVAAAIKVRVKASKKPPAGAVLEE